MILKNCEIWYAKLNPKRPSSRLNKENPTWEVQLRTTDKEVKKDWESKNLPVRAVVPDADDQEPYYRVNLRKKSIKKDGSNAEPPELIDGKGAPVDPDTIGNGSVANIRIYQYEYDATGGKKGIASILMAVQMVKHILFDPTKGREEFEEFETEVVQEKTSEEEF